MNSISDHPSMAAPKKMGGSKKCFLGLGAIVLVVVLVLLIVSFPNIKREILRSQASKAHDNGKYEDAIAKYQKLLEDFPKDAEIQYNLGVAYIANKQIDKAQAQTEKLRKLGNNEYANILQELMHGGMEKTKDRSQFDKPRM